LVAAVRPPAGDHADGEEEESGPTVADSHGGDGSDETADKDDHGYRLDAA